MKTNYISHDELYKKRKAEGKQGWTTPEQVEDYIPIVEIEKTLQPEYIPKSGNLLELGCGAGDFTLWLAEISEPSPNTY